MKPRPWRWIRWPTGVLMVSALLAALAMGSFHSQHVLLMTGRVDVPKVSCDYCHRDVSAPLTRAELDPSPFLSPEGMAVSPDGRSLFVAAATADRLLEVDLERSAVARSVRIEGGPHGVALSPDGRQVVVTLRDTDRIAILDRETLTEVAVREVGFEPIGLAFGRGGRLFVANGASDDLSIVETTDASATRRVVAGNEPYAVAVSADGRTVAVANRLAFPVGPGEVPASELTLVDGSSNRVRERRLLRSAHLSEGVAVSSDGAFALATVLRIRNLLPLTQVARGGVMNSALAYVENHTGGRTAQLPLDETNAFFADPSGVVMTPDDRIAFVAHGGAQTVTAVDVTALRELVARTGEAALHALADDLGASGGYVLARIPTRENPRALAMSPDGRRVYVAERLAGSVAVIDTATFAVIEHIALGGSTDLTTQRRGEMVFHDASRTFQGQFSCRSCHPDGHTDGLIWDFEIDGIGRNLVDTRSLRGVRDTAPFKWNGKNRSLATQCGPRFARVLTRAEPFTPDQLADLVAFIESIPRPPAHPRTRNLEALERGREIFFRTHTHGGEPIQVANRCQTCHRPPLFTDRFRSDVGSEGAFDTPHLLDVGSSAPYLHDGRAASLEELWTVYSPEDTHGFTSDLSKADLNDLVTFLRSL